MRQATRKGLLTMAAATGVLAAAGGVAQAASGASGSASNSPGVLSGNSVQAPVYVPVNVCGNTVDVVGALNPATGNSCANNSGTSDSGASADSGGYGDSSGSGGSSDTGATGSTSDSPGVASGNHVQAPVEAPVNVCGNTVDVVGALNPATGNDCGSGPSDDDDGYGTPPGPGKPGVPEDRNVPPAPPSPDHRPPAPHDDSSVHGHRSPGTHRPASHAAAHTGGTELASTGIGLPVGAAGALGAGAVLGGAVLYRRARRSA